MLKVTANKQNITNWKILCLTRLAEAAPATVFIKQEAIFPDNTESSVFSLWPRSLCFCNPLDLGGLHLLPQWKAVSCGGMCGTSTNRKSFSRLNKRTKVFWLLECDWKKVHLPSKFDFLFRLTFQEINPILLKNYSFTKYSLVVYDLYIENRRNPIWDFLVCQISTDVGKNNNTGVSNSKPSWLSLLGFCVRTKWHHAHTPVEPFCRESRGWRIIDPGHIHVVLGLLSAARWGNKRWNMEEGRIPHPASLIASEARGHHTQTEPLRPLSPQNKHFI